MFRKPLISALVFSAIIFSISPCFAQKADSAKDAKPAGLPEMPPAKVLVENVFSRPEKIDKKYVGTLEAINTVTSTTRVSGDILKVTFQEGDLMKAGDLLFEIDDTRYVAAVESAEGRIAQIKARLKYLKASYERNKGLYDEITGVSKDEIENIESLLTGSEADLRVAEAALVLAEDDLKHTKIYSQITGRAGRLVYSRGNYVTPASGALITVVQMDPIYVRFSMSERDFISMFGNVETLQKEASVELQLADGTLYKDGGEEPMRGKIEFIDNSVRTSTDSIQIWASFKNPTEKLNAGGIARIHLSKTGTVEYPAVKSSAIMFTASGPTVYVIGPENTPQPRPVTLGTSDGVYRTVLTGLQDGETVITDGTHKVMMLPVMGPDGKTPVGVAAKPVIPVTEAERDAEVKTASENLAKVKAQRETPEK